MKKIRKKLIVWLFEKSQGIYVKFKRKTPWNLTTEDFLTYPENTLGHAIGIFLKSNGFEPIPKVERHDAYHLVTNYGTSVEEEIALQYLCLANGKRSLYLFGVIIVGTLLLPDYLDFYIKSYHLGKSYNSFHNWNYKNLLDKNLEELQANIQHSRCISVKSQKTSV